MKTVLKLTLLILCLALLAGVAVFLVFKLQWPWWSGFSLFAGMLGIIVAFLFLRRYLLRQREQGFVRRVVELDDAAIHAAPIHERQQLQDLQERWKTAIDRLNDSYLRKKGNPLYVLPWYLVLGETGTGKTSAINNARLSSPVAGIDRSGAMASTKNCDWWFFKEAIVLDAAGRYAIPLNEGQDQEEWEKFLSLLARYRRREPLNGLIVTVAADTLLAGEANRLREDGQNIRKRIDQLMRVVGAKFPVYLLVTKMDLVYGFIESFDTLPRDEKQQVMGCLNRSMTPYWHEFLDRAWTATSRRLRDLRLHLLGQSAAPDPAALVFTSEFDRLRPGLQIFIQAVFEENPYQETPLPRGLFFSCATQEGRPQSAYLEQTGRPERAEEGIVPKKEKGIFLTDLFKTVLPGDRFLFRPIAEFIRWRRLTNSMGLMAWLLICLACCGFLTISFLHNRTAIREFQNDFPTPPVLKKDLFSDLVQLEKLRIEINDMEKTNRYWILPRLGLTESLKIEEVMKQRFVQLFNGDVRRPFDHILMKRLADVTGHTSEDDLADYITYVVARVGILKTFVKSGNAVPSEVFKKSASDVLVLLHPGASQEIASLYADLFYTFLSWGDDKHTAQAHLEILQNALATLHQKTPDLHWLVRKWLPDASPVLARDFWGEPEGLGYEESEPVPGAYTNKGREHIQAFIEMVENALANPRILEKKKKDFWEWYTLQYMNHWSSMIRQFDHGAKTLQTWARKRNMATLMTTDRNPYFRLIEKVADETSWIDVSQRSAALAFVAELNAVIKLARSESQKEKGTLLAKLAGEKEQLSQKIRTGAEKGDGDINVMEKRFATAKIWKDYTDSLEKLSSVVISQETAFRTASDFFTPPADTSQQSNAFIYLAYSHCLKLTGLIQVKGDMTEVRRIVMGPITYLLQYCLADTACYLQRRWENQVLGGLQGAPQDKIAPLLFDPSGGSVWKYIEGPAKPFITKGKAGYVPRRASLGSGNDHSVPFTQDFLEFLNTGAEGAIGHQPEYLVHLETLPIAVNDGAVLHPHANLLTLQCSDGQTTLKNFNYPQKSSFRWLPDKCSDTTLSILFPDLTLTRVYRGKWGFPQFLTDFKDGNRTFTPEDFPEARAKLKRLNVSAIRLSYKINGARPIVQALKKAPSKAPQEIVPCIDH